MVSTFFLVKFYSELVGAISLAPFVGVKFCSRFARIKLHSVFVHVKSRMTEVNFA